MNNKKAIITSTIVVLLLVMVVGIAYAFFTYENGERSEIVTGQIYMNYEETTNISLTNVWPETKEQALARTDENGVFEFTITGQNTSKYPIYYEVDLLSGGVVTGKTEASTRILPEHVMIYLEKDGEPVVDGVTYADWNSRRIYVETIPASTASITHNYVLRMWIDESVTISDTDPNADYTTEEWNDSYTSLQVRVVGDFEEKTMPTAADTIIASLGSNGLVAVADDGGLYTGDESQVIREYRYSGSNGVVTNNYVNFNDEKWRIIGVFPTEKEDGTIENLIKIIKARPLTDEEIPMTYTYNGVEMTLKRLSGASVAFVNWNEEKYFGQTNYNDWTKASLQYFLNDETEGSNSYYNSIDPAYQGMIQNTTYYLGNVNTNPAINTISSYIRERSSMVASGDIMVDNFWEGNSLSWNGKIGLMYPSDYGYAADSAYWDTFMSRYSEPANYDWLYNNVYDQWTISPSANDSNYAMYVFSTGSVGDSKVSNLYPISPVLYLKSDVKILGGTGTYTIPFELG